MQELTSNRTLDLGAHSVTRTITMKSLLPWILWTLILGALVIGAVHYHYAPVATSNPRSLNQPAAAAPKQDCRGRTLATAECP